MNVGDRVEVRRLGDHVRHGVLIAWDQRIVAWPGGKRPIYAVYGLVQFDNGGGRQYVPRQVIAKEAAE